MDASQLPKGQSSETTPGKPKNEAGVYRHEAAKVQIITQPGNDGAIQADALVRVGYKRMGDTLSREELLKMQKAQLAKDLAETKAEAEPVKV